MCCAPTRRASSSSLETPGFLAPLASPMSFAPERFEEQIFSQPSSSHCSPFLCATHRYVKSTALLSYPGSSHSWAACCTILFARLGRTILLQGQQVAVSPLLAALVAFRRAGFLGESHDVVEALAALAPLEVRARVPVHPQRLVAVAADALVLLRNHRPQVPVRGPFAAHDAPHTIFA